MASDRKIVSYRPDVEEEILLEKLSKKRAISASRTVGQILREAAAREGITVSAEEIAEKVKSL